MRQIADKIHLETGYPGVNVGAVVTRKGVICIDTPSFPRDARNWATRVHQLYPYSISYLLLTDAHGDRVLNCRWFNAPIISQQQSDEQLRSYDKRYPQMLLDSLITRDPHCGRELTSSPVEQPTLSFAHDLTLGQGRRRIELIHMPGPLPGVMWVHLPEAGILFTGDSVVNGEHPHLAQADCARWLHSLEMLLNDDRFSDVHTLVPGRGQVCDKTAVEPVMDYIRRMLDLVREHIALGRSKAQLTRLVPEMLSEFPANRWPAEWEERQIRLGLEHLYDEIQLGELAQTL